MRNQRHLATTYERKGMKLPAEETLLAAYTGYQFEDALDSPIALKTTCRLGKILAEEKKFEASETFYIKAIVGYEGIGAIETRDGMKPLMQLGNVYDNQGPRRPLVFTRDH